MKAPEKTFFNFKCNQCKNKPLIKDLKHNILYCGVCGLIHENNINPIIENVYFIELIRNKTSQKLFFSRNLI